MKMLLASLLLSMTVVAAETKLNTPGTEKLPEVDEKAVAARIDARLHALLQERLAKLAQSQGVVATLDVPTDSR